MKNFNTVLLSGAAILALIAFSSTAQAQSVGTYSVSLISGADTDVQNNGTNVLAFGFEGSPFYGASTIGFINGVNYGGSVVGGDGVTLNLGSSIAGNFYDGFTGVASAGNYNQLLKGEEYTYSTAAPTSFQLTFTGLAVGDTYQLQLFAADFRDGIATNTETLSGIGADTGSVTLSFGGKTGTYALVTFTALTSTQEFNLNSGVTPGGGNIAQFAGVGLQDLGAAEVPEPSTYALLGLGALALLVVNRSRRASLVG